VKASGLLRVGRNVAALAPAAAFYAEALGFEVLGPAAEDAELAALLGVAGVKILRLRLGAQEIELSECFPAGAAYPAGGASALWFQHIAILAPDMASAYGQVRQAAAISRDGPVRLPAASGGVTAYKFRDPEGHPLELLQFPEAAGKPVAGYDHSAISVADISASQAFYARIGLAVAARQLNQGAAQDALDGLDAVAVDVVALNPPQPAPHVELLGYRSPAPREAAYAPADICADRLVFGSADGGLAMLRDPDGHVVVLDGR